MIRKKVGTITLSIGLIMVGALLLAENFTTLPIKDFYKYWPVFFISLGAEFLIFSTIYSRGDQNVRLSIDGLCITFIIILGVIANVGNFVPLNFNFGSKGGPILNFNANYKNEMRESFNKNDISQNFDVKEVKITNNFGKIEVRPSDTKLVKVEADIRLNYNDEAKAREFVKNAIVIKEGEITEVSVKNYDGTNKDYSKAVVDFIVYVPDGACANIENSFGDITADNIKGKVEIKNSYGAVKASNITGDAILRNSFGRIALTKVGGNAEVKGSFGEIQIKDIKGSLKVENNNGEIDVENADSDVDITNSFGRISYKSSNITDAQIFAKTSFGDIRSSENINIEKSGQETKAEGQTGSGKNKIEITNKNGEIRIEK